ncbi:MAG: metal ABC transporter ATP-binding protein [Phycisphaeraceae bacterium]|nr:metal ABC transporter ATP-binding protein [Phycisphaeraceae bacterium]
MNHADAQVQPRPTGPSRSFQASHAIDPPPGITITGIFHRYPGAEADALEDVSLRVEPGVRLGILGPNGGGKSTLLKLILGLLPLQRGEILIGGIPPDQARRQGLIGYVPQKLEAELGLPISARQVVELGAAWRRPPWRPIRHDADLRARVDRLLELVGVRDYADKPIGSLSGGQVQRVLIARALASNARVLALDEPTVGIDASGQQRFADLLTAIHAELRPTILVISHDIRAVAAGSDRVACLARKLHLHTSPEGLTPRVLGELFAHDLAGLPAGLRGMHLHAHSAGECCDDNPIEPRVDLTISPASPRTRPPAD